MPWIMPDLVRQDLIKTHYTAFWNVTGTRSPFDRGPIHQLPPDFCVLEFPPHGDRNATCCMSQAGDNRPIELHVFSPRQTDEVAELLYATAHFHRTGERLGLNHTVNFGKPWIARSSCDHGFISLPYLDGPGLENGPHNIKFYWLIPITKAEVEYATAHGVNALEEMFEREPFNYLDPARTSVV
jgi:hypothetical protein